MTYYFIKETLTAPETNPNYAGCVHTYIYGKNQTLVEMRGTEYSDYSWLECDKEYTLKEYGYTRKCDTMRSYIYKHPQNDRYWTTVAEIIEIEG